MKSLFTIGLGCLALTQSVNAQVRGDIDDPYEREKKEYPSDEKEQWIYFDNA